MKQLKKLKRIPRIKDPLIRREFTRAHIMIFLLSLIGIVQTLFSRTGEFSNGALSTIIVILLAIVGLFSLLVAVTQRMRK